MSQVKLEPPIVENPDGSITVFLGGGLYNVEDAAGSPQVTKYYSVAGQRVAMDDGTLMYLLTDHLGSVVAVTDASGSLVPDSEQRYMPFGEPRLAGTSPTDFTYTGQRALEAMGLMDYNARWYDATLGRFVSPDVLVPDNGTTQGLNKYSYALNNTVNVIDSSGSCPRPPASEDPILCIALFISPEHVNVPGLAILGGDDRGFGPESNAQNSRGYIWINIAKKTFEAHENPTHYISSVPSNPVLGPSEQTTFEIEAGPSADNDWNVYWIDDNTFIVDYDLVLGGWLGIFGATHINGVMNFHINRDGSIRYGIRRDGYPWAEGYVYLQNGDVETVFENPAERGNPYDLLAIEPNIGPIAFFGQAQGFVLGEPLVSSLSGVTAAGLIKIYNMDILFAFGVYK